MRIEYSHTPGPWQVNSGVVETASGIPIAYMDRNAGNGTLPVERDSNVHLIASAPDLLASLKEVLRALESHIDDSCRSQNVNRDVLCPCNQNEIKRARAIIAKTENRP
jgi:hypothetical protein